jgi:hypothetical protein
LVQDTEYADNDEAYSIQKAFKKRQSTAIVMSDVTPLPLLKSIMRKEYPGKRGGSVWGPTRKHFHWPLIMASRVSASSKQAFDVYTADRVIECGCEKQDKIR